jgi:hypothetical protein
VKDKKMCWACRWQKHSQGFLPGSQGRQSYEIVRLHFFESAYSAAFKPLPAAEEFHIKVT